MAYNSCRQAVSRANERDILLTSVVDSEVTYWGVDRVGVECGRGKYIRC